MSLLDRLKGDEDPHISAHQFWAALVALADGQTTRAQVETTFNIATTGADKTELDFVINGYQAAVDKGRYLDALHAVFSLLENGDFPALTKAQIQAWLTAAEAAY